MKRREFIALLGGAAAAWPVAARAQQPAGPAIGFLNSGTSSDYEVALRGLRQGLREAGFIEGQNLAIEYRWAEDENARLPALAAELIQRRVQVIVAAPNLASLRAAKAVTGSIPIVFLTGPDPVRAGLVAGVNQAGGNLTGVTLFSSELTAKRLGLLHDLVPQVTTIAMLLDGRVGVQNQDFNLNEADSAGRNVGLRIVGVTAASETDFDTALTTAVHDGASALLVSSSISFINHRDELVAAAARHGLPAIYQTREYAAAGGLMSYGPDTAEAYRQVGTYVGRVLKGAKPADLPVIQPARFELVLNLKTAKAIGITFPPSLLATADEVIE